MDLWQQYCLLNLIDPHLYLFLIFSAVFLFRVMLNSVFSRDKGKADEERKKKREEKKKITLSGSSTIQNPSIFKGA